ncbi:MAG TPA: M23 family metallopeptidase [Euzebyales bacterium]
MTTRLRPLTVIIASFALAATVTTAHARPDPGPHAAPTRTVVARTDGRVDPSSVWEPALTAIAPVGGRVLRPFDPPDTPYGHGHRGVDLAAVPGEPVRAALAGTVRFAGRVAGVTWVTVVHAGGLTTTYGGFAATVRAGDRLDLGTPLGRAGRRGRLDWGARRDGAYIDPLGLLGARTVRLVPLDG